MAENNNKEKKNKKGITGILLAIFLPILIIVFVGLMFFNILDAIIAIIKAIVKMIIQAILNFLKNPVGFAKEKWAQFTNWLNGMTNIGSGEFNPDEYEARRIKPCVIIGLTEFETMKNNLSDAINRNAAGLNDVMLKKMLLAYYSGTYLDDTAILIELTEEEIKDIDNKKTHKPYKKVKGNAEEGKGLEGKQYLEAQGIIRVEKGGKPIIYYEEATLTKIYNEHYLKIINDDNEDNDDYAESVLDYLEKCYTYGKTGIKKYITVDTKTVNVWKYENEAKDKILDSDRSSNITLADIEYYEKVAQYTVPMEFMMNLLEITGSHEFLNSFIETVAKETYIKMDLETIVYKETTKKTYEKTRESIITGTKKPINYSVKRSDGTTDGLELIEQPIDGEEKVNITIKDNNSKSMNVHLLANNVVLKTDLLSNNNGWTITYNGLNKPSQEPKDKTDISKVTDTITTVKEERKYDLLINEIKTWYAIISQDNTRLTETTYYSVTEDKEEVSVGNENSAIKIQEKDKTNEYTKTKNPDIISVDDSDSGFKFTYNIEECLKDSFNYIIRIPEKKYNFKEYEYEKMQTNDTNSTVSTLKTIETRITNEGPQKVKDNTDLFLGLLSNSDGKYELGKAFKAKSSGGKVVKYEDIYESTVGAGELLENGAEMLFTLLEESPNTQGLTDVMRYIMYKYSGINYGVTEFNFSPFSLEGVLSGGTVIGNTIEEKVWCTLINKGYTEFAAAGVMGNIYQESKFNPKLNEAGGDGFGLCQWSFSRRDKLEAYAAAKGVEPTDVNTQIEFLLAELNEAGGCNGYAEYELKPSSYSGTLYKPKDWIEAKTVEDATKAFCYTFERPNLDLVNMEVRVKKAQEYYDKYAGMTIEDITGVTPEQLKVVDIAKNSASYGIVPKKDRCLAWVNDVIEKSGANVERKNCALCSGYYFGVSKDFSIIPVGAAVYGEKPTSTGAARLYGHVAIYIGDGMVMDNIGHVRTITLESWINQHANCIWGWTSSVPLNSNYPITKGLIRKGSGSNCV